MEAAPKILVTGSNGQLGSELKDLAPLYPQYQFVFFNRSQWPIDDEAVSASIFEEHKPQFVVNCAAYTAVDKAESEKETALRINGTAAGILARLCSTHGARFIHISTDYVFDGQAQEPITESLPVNPINSYGQTKLAGEQAATGKNPDSVIIRTSWVYSSYGNNFVKTMMRLMKERESLGVVNDQYGSPTYAADLAAAIIAIIRHSDWTPGIYNYSNEGVITWFEFAEEIRKSIDSSCIVNPITTAQFPTPAKRPAYSVLDKSKIISTYPVQLRDWKESLKECIGKLLADS
ncbi:MAG TPA: dTDP-4-dehydrorhamnose reductase [Flavisolibacter sp.]